VGVDDATVPIPQTVFKKFYDSMAGWMAGEVAEAEKVGTRSRLGPGARCDSGEGGDRPGETSGRVAPSRADVSIAKRGRFSLAKRRAESH